MVGIARSVLGLLVLGLFCALTAAAQGGADALSRRIVVFSQETPPAERLKIAESTGGRLVRELPLINAVVVEGAPPQLEAIETRLRLRRDVARVDPDPRVNWLLTPAPAPSEAQLPDLHAIIKPFRPSPPPAEEPGTLGQQIPWGIKRVNAPAAWGPSLGGQGVKVAVIDTGIDYDHPDLKANIAGGWNAITKASDFKDDNGHGTHCSGIIAALNNDIGVVGVAPQASLYGVKVLDQDGSGTFDDVIAGMQWAVENRMQVASMSLGADKGNESLKAAVAAMAKAGVVLIAAAGNSGGPVGFPAAYPGAIAVAASDINDKVASFSSRGPEVAVIAPGVDVLSTYMGGGYETLSGTSMATPHVSGLAALAIAAKRLSGEPALRAALKAAASPLDAPAEQQGAGMVDAVKLVR